MSHIFTRESIWLILLVVEFWTGLDLLADVGSSSFKTMFSSVWGAFFSLSLNFCRICVGAPCGWTGADICRAKSCCCSCFNSLLSLPWWYRLIQRFFFGGYVARMESLFKMVKVESQWFKIIVVIIVFFHVAIIDVLLFFV